MRKTKVICHIELEISRVILKKLICKLVTCASDSCVIGSLGIVKIWDLVYLIIL